MYHRAVHLQWPYQFPPPVHAGNLPRSGSPHAPVFITNCAELIPVLTVEHFGSPAFFAQPNGGLLPSLDFRLQPNNKVRVQPPSNQVFVANSKIMPQQSRCVENKQEKQSENETKNCENKREADSPTKLAKVVPEVIDLCDSDNTDSKSQETRGQKRHHEPPPSTSSNQETGSPVSLTKKRFLLQTPEKTEEKQKSSTVLPINDPPVDTNTYHKVADAIWNLYLSKRQSEETFGKKIQLRDALFRFLKELMPTCGLYIVGSSLTGLGGNSSDLDMCIMLYPHEINQEVEAINILKYIQKHSFKCPFMYQVQLIAAKVPILKFKDRVSGIDVDMNVNNAVGIRNTQLLNCYSRLDQRLAPLSVVVKLWAQQRGINDARNATLSSYSLILMLINFLQCGCDPPVLPCLQKLLPNKFQANADVRHMVLREEIPNFSSANKKNAGQLFLEFLNYYGNVFDFSNEVVSIRIGGKLPKPVAMNCPSPKNKRGWWKFICIEEPFDRSNTARSVYHEEAFQRILTVFRSSHKQLVKTQNLATIMTVNFP